MNKKRRLDSDQEETSKKIRVESLLNSEQTASSSSVTQVNSSEEKISSLENNLSEIEKDLDDFRRGVNELEPGTMFTKYLNKSAAKSEERKSTYDEAIQNAASPAISNSLRIEILEKSMDQAINDISRSLQELPAEEVEQRDLLLEINENLTEQKNEISSLNDLRVDHPKVDSPEPQSSSEESSSDNSSEESSSDGSRSRGSSLLDDYADLSQVFGDFTGGDD